MTDSEAIRAALIESAEEYFSRYDMPADAKPHRFSLLYRIRKTKIKRLAAEIEQKESQGLPQEIRIAKRYIPLKKMTVILAVIVAAVFLAAAAGAVYFGARGFIFDVHKTHSDVSVDFSEYDIKDSIEEIYYLPLESGYELVSEQLDSEIAALTYSCGNNRISLAQYAGAFTENYMVNTENSDIYEVEVGDGAGFILIRHRQDAADVTMISWIYDKYLFEIVGVDLKKSELIELAESITAGK